MINLTDVNSSIFLKASLNHPSFYLAVGLSYGFEATATDGTNITLQWDMETGSVINRTYDGIFSTGYLNYTFSK